MGVCPLEISSLPPLRRQRDRSTLTLDESLGWNEPAFVKALAGNNVLSLSGLVNVYRAHHDRYHALATRLAQTDRLIDEVVYRSYGLTQEEIAIVEG